MESCGRAGGDHGIDVDLAALEAAVADAAVAGAAERTERARQDEERAAARRTAHAAEVAEVQKISGRFARNSRPCWPGGSGLSAGT